MRRLLLPAIVSATLTVFSINDAAAQQERFAYAITDLTKQGLGWNALRKLDLQTGEYSDVLLNGTDAGLTVYDATTKKEIVKTADARFGNLLYTPFSTGVAAAAYDKKNDRLYFTPMFVDQLRYIDLKTMKVYYITDQAFTGLGNMHNYEGKIITRMVIAPDGNGYAISNDANTFIRFTTGKKPKIEQLGALVDDPSNGGISIHNRCTSFGGDMISDDKGNLIIITARNQVFKINTETKVADYIAPIQGLSANFTVNGAVVDGDGNLLVSSAVDAASYYLLNPKDWNATPYVPANGPFRSSDLANSNFLGARGETKPVPTIAATVPAFADQISVYPNPVTTNNLTIQFNKVPAGNYVLEMRDVLGRSVMQRKITVNGENTVQTISLNKSDAKGVYMLAVLDGGNKNVFAQKVVVE